MNFMRLQLLEISRENLNSCGRKGRLWGWDMVRYTRYKELKENLAIEGLRKKK